MNTSTFAAIERIVKASMTTKTVQELEAIFANCTEDLDLSAIDTFPQEFLEMLAVKINKTKTLKSLSISIHSAEFGNLQYFLGHVSGHSIESFTILASKIDEYALGFVEKFIYDSASSLRCIHATFTDFSEWTNPLDIPEFLSYVGQCSLLESLSITIALVSDHMVTIANTITMLPCLKHLLLRFSSVPPPDATGTDYNQEMFDTLSDAIMQHECIHSLDFQTTNTTKAVVNMVHKLMKGNKNIATWALNIGPKKLALAIGGCQHIRNVHLNSFIYSEFKSLLQHEHIQCVEISVRPGDEEHLREPIERLVEANTTLLHSRSLENFSLKCAEFIRRNNKKLAVSKLNEIVPSLCKLGFSVWVMLEIVQKLLPDHPSITTHFVVKTCTGIIASIDRLKK